MDTAQQESYRSQRRLSNECAICVSLFAHVHLGKLSLMLTSDIDGDGKADAIWLHPQDASGVVWLNKDPSTRAGWHRQSSFPQNQIPASHHAAANFRFARIQTAHGRADLIETDPQQGIEYLWRNDCKSLAPGSNDNRPVGSTPPSETKSREAECGAQASSHQPPAAKPASHKPASHPETLTIGGTKHTGNPEVGFVIAGHTLKPGHAITVSGTPISLAKGGTVAVVHGITQKLTGTTSHSPHAPAHSETIFVGGKKHGGNPESGFVIEGHTLKPGHAITVSGTSISLGKGGTVAVVQGVTQKLSIANPTRIAAPKLQSGDVIVVGKSTYIGKAGSGFTIDGQALHPGGHITAHGTPISLAQGGGFVVVVSGFDQVPLDSNVPRYPCFREISCLVRMSKSRTPNERRC